MALNSGVQKGIQKYQKASGSGSTAKKQPVAAKAAQASKTAASKSQATKAKQAVAAAIEANEVEIEVTDEQQQEAAKAAVEQEIAQEMEKEQAQTNRLVRADFSPVNTDRDRLIVEYSPLIKFIAQKIASRLPANVELDDLISSGVIGLMDAIDKYDSSRDNKFKTYAEFRIRGAILDELRAQDWVPRSVREKAKMLERAYTRIEQKMGRSATDEEVCEDLNLSTEEFHDLLNEVRGISLLSFDDIANLSKQDKRAIHGYGEATGKSGNPFSEFGGAQMKKVIAEAIADLPEKQRLVLSLYYYEDLNLKEIGRVLDVTESRVSQLHTQAVLRLRARLRSHLDDLGHLL